MFSPLQECLSAEQVAALVNYLPTATAFLANSMCFAAPSVAAKGEGVIAARSAVNTQFTFRVLHGRRVTQIKDLWVDGALVGARVCNRCGKGVNVARDGFYCKVCEPHPGSFVEQIDRMKYKL